MKTYHRMFNVFGVLFNVSFCAVMWLLDMMFSILLSVTGWTKKC